MNRDDRSIVNVSMGRINRPSIMVYGGTIRGGRTSSGQVVDIVNAFQSYGEYLAGSIDEGERSERASLHRRAGAERGRGGARAPAPAPPFDARRVPGVHH